MLKVSKECMCLTADAATLGLSESIKILFTSRHKSIYKVCKVYEKDRQCVGCLRTIYDKIGKLVEENMAFTFTYDVISSHPNCTEFPLIQCELANYLNTL